MLSHNTPSRPTKKWYGKDTRANAKRKPPTKTAKGAFLNRTWQCDCSPRLPAERFQVKKEGPNKGKWFYTCQMSNKDSSARGGCGFFLWQYDAQLREEAAVLGNSRSEPAPPKDFNKVINEENASLEEQFAGLADYDGDTTESEEAPSPSKRTGTKRTSTAAGLDDRITRSSNRPQALETPRKAPKLSNGYLTPADTVGTNKNMLLPTDGMQSVAPLQLKGSSRVDQLLTPKTPRVSSISVMPVTPQTAASLLEQPVERVTTPIQQKADPMMGPPPAPHPSRHYDALKNADSSESQLVKDVMAALAPAKIPPDAEQRLRAILSRHEVVAEGVRRGREISRAALAVKTSDIAQLQEEKCALEGQVAELQARIRGLESASFISQAQTPRGSSSSTSTTSTLGQMLRS